MCVLPVFFPVDLLPCRSATMALINPPESKLAKHTSVRFTHLHLWPSGRYFTYNDRQGWVRPLWHLEWWIADIWEQIHLPLNSRSILDLYPWPLEATSLESQSHNHLKLFICIKGQIISECPYEKIVCPKIATKKFPRFLPWPLRRGQIKNFIKPIMLNNP